MLIQILYIALRIGIELIEYLVLNMFKKRYAMYDLWL